MELNSPSPRSSRRTSVYSQANSTRPMLADWNDDGGRDSPQRGSYLAVPQPTSTTHLRSPDSAVSLGTTARGDGVQTPSSAVSLSVNYLPSKFSSVLMNRKPNSRAGVEVQGVPKRGGGLAAFKSGEARMGGALRWTRFKWALLVANTLLTLYSFAGLIFCLLLWTNSFPQSEIIRVANTTELILSTTAAALGIAVALLGWAGLLLNDRAYLAWYTFLLWAVFAILVTPAYITFRKRQYNLEGKVNAQWSRALGPLARQRIQGQLACCGYYSPYVEATVSQTCYSRSVLPGCKQPYLEYQRDVLQLFWKVLFSIVPAHLVVMVAALLCSDHVTYRFGKGMMPEAYRLNMDSMGVIIDQYAAQLADQYGPEVAEKAIVHAKSNMSLRDVGR